MLLEYLREERALLVLDNLETLMEEGEGLGRLRPGYEDYARRLRRVAETGHKSCLLLTSREKPSELVPLEGSRTPVRSSQVSWSSPFLVIAVLSSLVATLSREAFSSRS